MRKKYYKIPKYKGAAIYGIINIEDMKIYIGNTTDAHKRALQHMHMLETGTHYNSRLQSDSDKSLRFVILYKIPDAEIKFGKLLEKIYMMESVNKGYNLYNIQCADDLGKLKKSIILDCVYYFGVSDKMEDAIYKEYHTHTWHIKNTKYRYDYYCK